jgi:hypothetical protein
MQLVDPAHQGQIAVRHWTRKIIDAATAEAVDTGSILPRSAV